MAHVDSQQWDAIRRTADAQPQVEVFHKRADKKY